MRLHELPAPDSHACHAALDVATTYATPALLHHSLRSYWWAAGYAVARGIRFDAELLYVSALLHDLALVPAFDNFAMPFEEAGGHLAWVFTAGAGWPRARRQRAADIIVRHMWDTVDVEQDPEGHLLELSTAMDVSGRQTGEIPPDLRADVLARYPRLDLADEIVGYFEEQARRKPACSAARFVASGFAQRVRRNPLDRSS